MNKKEKKMKNEIIPVSNFHMRGRQVIGLKLDATVPLFVSFMISVVLPDVIHFGTEVLPCTQLSS